MTHSISNYHTSLLRRDGAHLRQMSLWFMFEDFVRIRAVNRQDNYWIVGKRSRLWRGWAGDLLQTNVLVRTSEQAHIVRRYGLERSCGSPGSDRSIKHGCPNVYQGTEDADNRCPSPEG